MTALFNATGERLLTSSEDGTARLWFWHFEDRDPGTIRATVTRLVPWRLSGGALVAKKLLTIDSLWLVAGTPELSRWMTRLKNLE